MATNLAQQLVWPAQLLIASIWQGLLLTGMVGTGLELARLLGLRLRASTRFTLWWLVFLLVAGLPLVSLLKSLTGAGLTQHGVPSALQMNAGWAFFLESVWLLCSLVSVVRVFAGVREARVLVHDARAVRFAALSPELQTLLTRNGARPIEIRLSETSDAPSVVGFFHPTVIVPSLMWSELAPREQHAIVLHEKAHLDRWDDWTNLFQKLLRAFSPLNPALAWAERRLCQEREQACDDAVLQVSGDARLYATCLTRLAENRLVKRAAALAPGLWKRPSELTVRVENILRPRPTVGRWLSRAVVGASMMLVASGAVLLQRFPALVSFGGGDPVSTDAAVSAHGQQTASLVRTNYLLRPEDRVVKPNGKEDLSHDLRSDMLHNPPVASASPRRIAAKARAPRAHPQTRIAYWQLRSDERGLTLILFTVETPRGKPAGVTRPAPAVFPAFPFLNDWFDTQI